MTLITQSSGTRITVGAKLTTTGATTILTGTANIVYTIDKIHWSVDTAGSTLDMWWSDGTNNFYIVKTESEGANTRDGIENLHIVLRNGYTLKAQAGTANKIDITVVALQTGQSASSPA